MLQLMQLRVSHASARVGADPLEDIDDGDIAALEATRRAGQLALNYFEARVDVEWKQDLSPVTIADRTTYEKPNQ